MRAPSLSRNGFLKVWAALTLPALSGCSWWFFSSVPDVDRTRPVALIETTGGVELGATTEYGILTLGRTAKTGPCRVHYFLGPTPMVEDGTIGGTGSAFWLAESDLRTQHLRVIDHGPTAADELLAMWTPDGVNTQEVPVKLAAEPGITGDVLADPGCVLPPGAAIFARDEADLRFVGLVSAVVTQAGGGGPRYYTFAGVDRVREMLAVPTVWPVDYQVRYRPDDITVLKPIQDHR